jgi:large repetitive protein
VTFTFVSDTPGATFECATDGGAFSPCSSPMSYYAVGTHTFAVRAVYAGLRGVADSRVFTAY